MVLLQRVTSKEAISMPAGCSVFRLAQINGEQYHWGAFRWGARRARQAPKACRESKPFRGQGFPDVSPGLPQNHWSHRGSNKSHLQFLRVINICPSFKICCDASELLRSIYYLAKWLDLLLAIHISSWLSIAVPGAEPGVAQSQGDIRPRCCAMAGPPRRKLLAWTTFNNCCNK